LGKFYGLQVIRLWSWCPGHIDRLIKAKQAGYKGMDA
jgi:hypothetical protein